MKNETLAVFQHLIACAVSGHTTTYEETAIATGLPSSGNALGAALTPILTDIFSWCRKNNHPHLTALVVRKSGQDAGLPGRGFWNLLELPVSQERVCRVALTLVFQNEVFRMYGGLGTPRTLTLNLPEDEAEAKAILKELTTTFKEA